jgi:hypothetical protein
MREGSGKGKHFSDKMNGGKKKNDQKLYTKVAGHSGFSFDTVEF